MQTVKKDRHMRKPSAGVKQSNVRRITVVIGALILLALALPAQADIAVKFFGDSVPDELSTEYEAVVNNFFGEDPRERSAFACFQGDLLDLQNGRLVGIGVDCLSTAIIDDFTGGATDPPEFGPISNTADVSAVIDAVTFFFLPGGYIVSDGFTTVRPFFVGYGNGDGSDNEGSVTHLTGSIPGEAPSIVAATGRFSKLTDKGNVRLSGAVNLGLEGSVFFSCLFVIQNGPGRAQ